MPLFLRGEPTPEKASKPGRCVEDLLGTLAAEEGYGQYRHSSAESVPRSLVLDGRQLNKTASQGSNLNGSPNPVALPVHVPLARTWGLTFLNPLEIGRSLVQPTG